MRHNADAHTAIVDEYIEKLDYICEHFYKLLVFGVFSLLLILSTSDFQLAGKRRLSNSSVAKGGIQ